MANYNGYFPKDNPKCLEEKYSWGARMAQRKMRYNMGPAVLTEEEYLDELINAYKQENLAEKARETAALPFLD